MNKSEIKKAEKMLEDYAERTETAIYGSGQCLTAYWFGGDQKVFYSLAEIEAWIEDREQR